MSFISPLSLTLSRSEFFHEINVCVILKVILHVNEKHNIAYIPRFIDEELEKSVLQRRTKNLTPTKWERKGKTSL